MAEPTEPRTPLAPWDRRELPGLFSVEETARRVGHYKWTEMRIFEVLGGWVATVPEVGIKARLGVHCYHHAWHAELWHDRLPQLGGVDPSRLTVPPNDAYEAFLDALGEPQEPEQTIERLVGLYRVLLPRLIAAYTFHLNGTAEVTDAPTIRALRFCLQDDLDEWREGEMLVQSLLGTPAEVERAAMHQARLESLLLVSGGVAGPGSVGSFDGAPAEPEAGA